jgi:NAD-dependent deacetylase
MKKLVVLTGAGISAESGIKTFRESGGLWEGHDVMKVASPIGWNRDAEVVLQFYNERRKQALKASPNKGHKTIAELEKDFKVTVITQNVDNLHEKSGSTHVIHLHGELFKSRSTIDPALVYDIQGWELKLGDHCEKGSQLRPHIVWFGEEVPMMDIAVEETLKADAFMVVGTSLQVYPAAGLIEYVPQNAPKYIIDPHLPQVSPREKLFMIGEKATTGVPAARNMLLDFFDL